MCRHSPLYRNCCVCERPIEAAGSVILAKVEVRKKSSTVITFVRIQNQPLDKRSGNQNRSYVKGNPSEAVSTTSMTYVSPIIRQRHYRLTHPGSSNTLISATQSKASHCCRSSSACDALSVMNSIPTEPSWNMALSLSIWRFVP